MPFVEERLPGGNAGGAVLVDGTVRRPAGEWTPTVHALLDHLHEHGFDRAPRPLGYDDDRREVLTYLPGSTVGDTKPWPSWVHADDTLLQVADWLRDYHAVVADFVPPAGAVWRMGGTGSSTGTSPVLQPRSGTWPSPPAPGCHCTPDMSRLLKVSMPSMIDAGVWRCSCAGTDGEGTLLTCSLSSISDSRRTAKTSFDSPAVVIRCFNG